MDKRDAASEANSYVRFSGRLGRTLIENACNMHGAANWDYLRFGKRPADLPHRLFEGTVRTANALLGRAGIQIVKFRNMAKQFESFLLTHGQGLADLYGMLEDDYSRQLLVDVMAYRLLGYNRVKLPTHSVLPETWAQARTLMVPYGDSIDTHFLGWRLNRFDLSGIGYPISVYSRPSGVASTFVRRDYCYERITPPAGPRPGDYVIDGGGAWGDTALLFAWQAGETGRVFSFEFEPVNLDIMRRNLGLNADLSKRIETIHKALWNRSDQQLSFASNGPGTRVGDEGTVASEHTVATIAIDDLCQDLPRMDFIKMDIEGAELEALRGAAATIRRCQPRLAISLYHRIEDFSTIPRFLSELGVEYSYFLGHFSIHKEETVLFAVPRTPAAE